MYLLELKNQGSIFKKIVNRFIIFWTNYFILSTYTINVLLNL